MLVSVPQASPQVHVPSKISSLFFPHFLFLSLMNPKCSDLFFWQYLRLLLLRFHHALLDLARRRSLASKLKAD